MYREYSVWAKKENKIGYKHIVYPSIGWKTEIHVRLLHIHVLSFGPQPTAAFHLSKQNTEENQAREQCSGFDLQYIFQP